MPCSDPAWIESAARMLMNAKPATVLDIGCGSGMGGFLARQYGEVWHGRYRPELWRMRIDGIEIFREYIAAPCMAIYSKHSEGSFRS